MIYDVLQLLTQFVDFKNIFYKMPQNLELLISMVQRREPLWDQKIKKIGSSSSLSQKNLLCVKLYVNHFIAWMDR